MNGPSEREYLRSHPWIRFELDLRQADPRFWALLGLSGVVTCGYDQTHQDGGARVLKNYLGEYLRIANDGERLAVTNRGVVVARLVSPDAEAETAEEALRRLARAGEIRVGKANRPDLYPSPPGLMSDEEVATLMDEVRGDR